MTSELVERLAEVQRATADRKVDARERYYSAVFASGRGEEIDPGEVALALADYDVTIEQFEADCAKYVQRAAWVAELDCDRDSSQTIDDASAEIGRLVAERNRAVEKFQAQINQQVARRDEAVNLSRRAAGIKHELKNNAWPFLTEAVAEIKREMRTSGEVMQQLQITIKTEEANLRRHENLRDFDERGTHRTRSAAFVTPEVKKHSGVAAKECEKRIAQLEKQLLAMRDESESRLKEIEALEQRMLTP